MYVYFDKFGIVKEYINDNIVCGVHGAKIYVMFELDQGSPAPFDENDINIRYIKVNGSTTELYAVDSTKQEMIPIDRNRDLRFFQYGKTYRFRVFEIPEEVLQNVEEVSKVASATISYDTEHVMDLISFMVQPSAIGGIEPQDYISIADYNYLLNKFEESTIQVDDALSTTSENPVQNKVITEKVNDQDAIIAEVQEAVGNTYNKQEIDVQMALKQNVLVSGTNIKTINNVSILGEGNIDIQGGSGAVDSVNGKTGDVVLKDNDIHISTDLTNTKTIHSELERLDEGVETAIEIAEGKKNAYVLSYSDNPEFNSTDDAIAIVKPHTLTLINGDEIDIDDLKVGDDIYVTETSVPDRWVSENGSGGVWFNILETKADLSNYYTKIESDGKYQPKTEYITLSGNTGTISQANLNKLLANKEDKIINDNEIYSLQDDQEDSGYLVYSHTGQDTIANFYVKCIVITLNTLAWVRTSQQVQPKINLGVGTQDNLLKVLSVSYQTPIGNSMLKFRFLTQEQYDALGTYDNDTFYIIPEE